MNMAQLGSTARLLLSRTTYYLNVAKHIGIRVYEQERMSPPTSAEIDASLQGMRQVARHTASMVRNKQIPTLDTVKTSARVGLELLGFFTIGEMVGRWHLVGYKSHE